MSETKPTLSTRLQNLFSQSPRSSLDSTDNRSQLTTDDEPMWRAQQRTAYVAAPATRSQGSLGLSTRNLKNSSHTRTQTSPNILSLDLAQTASQLPIVRWFRGESSSQSSPSSVSTPSTPPSALREALEAEFPASPSPLDSNSSEALVRRLPPAHLAPPNNHYDRPSSVYRSPPFLENLARSTLPTASISRPPPAWRYSLDLREETTSCNSDTPCIDITQSPPIHTSLDTLRRVRDRGMPSVSNSENPSGSRPFSTSSPTRWWFGAERKADVDKLLDEDDQADTIEGEEAHMRKKYRAPRNPLVFCHGLLGFDSVQIGPSIAPMNVSHWRGIKEVLEARGIEVLITRVPATSSPMERAKVLEAKISEVYPGRDVHLIGHSMGGLDCRYLTTHLTHRKFRVLSITTVATPHRGSSFADHFIATVGKERLPQVVSLLDLLPNGGGDGRAFESLTLEAMRKFNEETPDVDGVKYYSWGATFEPGLIDPFKWSHSVILEKEGPNDGLVSVASSKWGFYVGTLEGVNHLDLVGWINTFRYKWAEFTGREIKFRPATFYLGVADHLARDVEGQGEEADKPESNTSVADPSHTPGGGNASENIGTISTENTMAGEGVNTVEGIEEHRPETPHRTSSLSSISTTGN